MSLKSQYTFARFREQVIEFLLLACALVSVATTVGLVVVLLTESVVSFGEERAFFQQISPSEFFTGTRWAPIIDDAYGVLPLIWGTVLVAGIAAVTGLPLGLLGAIYLSEYAHPNIRKVVKPFLEILAGIPTLVFGYFALRFITPYLLKPFFEGVIGWEVGTFNALSAGIVVGIMIIPMVCSISEDAIRSVPRSLREAGYALGSTKFDVCVRIVVPAATSGIIASFLLAISRAIGETMAVVIAAGADPSLTLNPLDSVQTMTAYMADQSTGDVPAGSMEQKSLYAVGLTLFCMTLMMNILAQWVTRKFREVYH